MDYNTLNEIIGVTPKSDKALNTLVKIETPEQFQAIIAYNSNEEKLRYEREKAITP